MSDQLAQDEAKVHQAEETLAQAIEEAAAHIRAAQDAGKAVLPEPEQAPEGPVYHEHGRMGVDSGERR